MMWRMAISPALAMATTPPPQVSQTRNKNMDEVICDASLYLAHQQQAKEHQMNMQVFSLENM
ncbi:hypothetical protein BLOT_012768 [Blomia tropicalis]|nr:hypothetical protein BLOT_012768 [Blomia tropicalis]